MPKPKPPVLQYSNNWESDEYRVSGLRVTRLSEVKIGRKKYKVRADERSVSYGDMGHTYSARSVHFFLQIPLGGETISVDMNTLPRGLVVIPTIYKLATT